MENTTLSDRIHEILAETKVTQMQLAIDAGVSKGLVTQWMNGGTKSINLEAARNLGRVHGYNPAWIMRGEGGKRGADTTFKGAPRSHDLNRLLAELEDIESMGPQWAALAQAITMLVRKLKETQSEARHEHLTPEMREIVQKLCLLDKTGGKARELAIDEINQVIAGPKPKSPKRVKKAS